MRLLIQTSNDYLKDLYSNKEKNYKSDSGFDLFVPEDVVIPGKSTSYLLDLQITSKMEGSMTPLCPDHRPYMLFPRSSMGKTPLRLANSIGLIDQDYRGPIMLILDNISDDDYFIKKGSRLVQIVSFNGQPFGFNLVSQLNKTLRGSNGLGSTGR